MIPLKKGTEGGEPLVPEDPLVHEDDPKMQVNEGEDLLSVVDSKDLEQELEDLGIGRRQFSCTPAQANARVLNLKRKKKNSKIY